MKIIIFIFIFGISYNSFAQKFNKIETIEFIKKNKIFSNENFQQCDCTILLDLFDSLVYNTKISKLQNENILNNFSFGIKNCLEIENFDDSTFCNKLFSKIIYLVNNDLYTVPILPNNLLYYTNNRIIDSLNFVTIRNNFNIFKNIDKKILIYSIGYSNDTNAIEILKKSIDISQKDTNIACLINSTLVRLGDTTTINTIRIFFENILNSNLKYYYKKDLDLYLYYLNYMNNKDLYKFLFDFLYKDFYYSIGLINEQVVFIPIKDFAFKELKKYLENSPLYDVKSVDFITNEEKEKIQKWLYETDFHIIPKVYINIDD